MMRTNFDLSLFAFFFDGPLFSAMYYLPVYFQSVDDTMPMTGGVRSLPLIIAVTISTVIVGIIITAPGQHQVVLIFGSDFGMAGAGLLYMLYLHAPTGRWIGDQVIAIIGWGIALQIPMMWSEAPARPKM